MKKGAESIMKIWLMRALVVVAVLALGAAGARAEDVAALYKSKCAVCHGVDGKGDTPAGKKLGTKDFHSPDVAKMSDAELFEVTKKGKDKMPGYDGKITDDQIRELVKYVRSLK
jgi:mono/diheme cytochrome c family protein